MRIGFIVNPRAGVHGKIAEETRELINLHISKEHNTSIAVTTAAGDAVKLSERFAAEGFDVVASVGGDGTASEVARGVAGSSCALAIVPFGSGNGLARGLGLPLNRADAVRSVLSSRRRIVDMGEVFDGDERFVFMGFCGIGYDAVVAKHFNERKGRRGLASYVLLSLSLYGSYKPQRLEIRVNGRQWAEKPFILAIANTSEYGNGAKIAPNAVPDDGLFEVCQLTDMSLMKGILNGWRLFNGSIDLLPGTTILRASEIEVIPESEIVYHLEGEARVTSRRLLFRVLPSAIRVVSPDVNPH